MKTYTRSPSLLSSGTSRFLLVDLQEKLLPAMYGGDEVVANCEKLIAGAQILNVPLSATEQYPKGLGPTIPQIADHIPQRPDKLRFSCAEALDWALADRTEKDRHQIVVAGIETHVCVLQTAFDLLSNQFDVFVVADAVTSRKPKDYDLALQRMRDSGVQIVTTEMVLFEWCEVAGSDEFKQISKLVR